MTQDQILTIFLTIGGPFIGNIVNLIGLYVYLSKDIKSLRQDLLDHREEVSERFHLMETRINTLEGRIDDVSEQVKKMETQLWKKFIRRCLILCTIVIILGVSSVVSGFVLYKVIKGGADVAIQGQGDKIICSELELVDAEGNPVISLRVSEGTGTVIAYSKNGESRAQLFIDEREGDIVIVDKEGRNVLPARE